MVVAVQSNLTGITEGLQQKGYTVVDLYSYGKPIDAVVFEGGRFDFSTITEENSSPVMSTNSKSSYGVFILCSNGKSIEEIDYMLKTRCYSSFI
ncbi:MAG TPA: YkuS family protein [Ruminiclostridium sp.]